MINIDPEVMKQTKEMFGQMKDEVEVLLFVAGEKDHHCLYCSETRSLVELVAEQSPLIKVKTCECSIDSPEAKEYNIDKHPAIIIKSKHVKGAVRFFGIPAGYEFGSLIEGIIDASTGNIDISENTQKVLMQVNEANPLHLQVFVTPTCPYCPMMVRLAHKFAMINPHIKGDCVEAMEFRDLSMKYNVMGVPRTIINETESLEGAAPEPLFLKKIEEALKK
ncbi:MAG: thioredoxin family protein [Promethearchaeota archaeon]